MNYQQYIFYTKLNSSWKRTFWPTQSLVNPVHGLLQWTKISLHPRGRPRGFVNKLKNVKREYARPKEKMPSRMRKTKSNRDTKRKEDV